MSTIATPYDLSGGQSTASTSRQVVPHAKPSLSRLNQQVLTEEEYEAAVSHIIKRQFFPSLLELDEHAALAHALAVDDPELVEASVRRMREIVTPRRKRNLDTPGRTPFGTEPSDTPAYFAETPDRETPRTRQRRNEPGLRYDSTLSLDNFQSRFTSEDNSSFADLLEKNNQERRVKHAWAWEAEQKANVKAIRGREARERLVDMTRTMVERDPNGTVRMISGGAGRPGERMLVVEGVKFDGEGERLMVKGSAETGRLMITSEESASGIVDRKGKGKAVAYIDYDKEDDDAYPIGDPTLDEQDVSVDTWGFTNRNSLMFPPDADVPSDRPNVPDMVSAGPPGDPKSIRYHATRLKVAAKVDSDIPSPSRSRINAAITGTPYHPPESASPRVAGFSFVDALPTPRASTISAESLQDLMTWGKIGTPVALRSSGAIARNALSSGGGPFNIRETSQREKLAQKLGREAKRSLGERESGLRRGVLDSTRTRGSVAGSPRSPRHDLSPAAQKLMGRTLQGKVLGSGLASTSGWEEENRRRLSRATFKARELESKEALRRARWTPSPAPSMGFDPDLADPVPHFRVTRD